MADNYTINYDRCKESLPLMYHYSSFNNEDIDKLCKGETVIDEYEAEINLKDIIDDYKKDNKESFAAYKEAGIIDYIGKVSSAITGYNCYEENIYEFPVITDVKIPNKLNGYVVTEIGAFAFSDLGLTSVQLPFSIEKIDEEAFSYNEISGELDLSYLTNLKSVDGFNDNQITSIKLPSSAETIGMSAFGYNAISGELDLSNTNLTTIGYSTFYKNQITSVKFPSTLETIKEYAFYWNQISGELDLSNTNLTTIGYSAFYYNKVNSIKLPSSIETIKEYAFKTSSGYLKIIVNPSGRSFDWSSITDSNTPDQNFVTGTITHQYGNIEVTAE